MQAVIVSMFATTLTAQTRLASDFEIAQMERQLASSRDFTSQLSGRLNLGDVRAARNEPRLARAEYEKALAVANRERLDARRDSNMTRYADATSYAALSHAKLGHDAEAFELAEESVRYASDSAKTWNLYGTAMTALGRRGKAAGAARNAVAIASRNVRSTDDHLDLAIYRYALASSVDDAEAETLLRQVTTALSGREFDAVRREVARGEQFEIYSSARGAGAAYLSLWNRAHLRLAALYERRGDREKARAAYDRVLEARTDDATALAALGRYEEAFDANPFSTSLIRDYRRFLAASDPGDIDVTTTGGQVRRALVQMHRGQTRAARESLDALIDRHPENATLVALRRELADDARALPGPSPTATELRSLVQRFDSLTPEERTSLDSMTFISNSIFTSPLTSTPGQTVLERGTIEGVPFRFSEPIAFAGTFGARLRLTYRILGVTREGDDDLLLLEPLGVQP